MTYATGLCMTERNIDFFFRPLFPPTHTEEGKMPSTALLHLGLKWNNVKGSMR